MNKQKKLNQEDHILLSFVQMVENKTTREAVLASDSLHVLHLYMVTHTPMHSQSSSSHTNFVLAYDESSASCQAECNIFDTQEAKEQERKRPSFHVSVARVPFLIRGWGSRKF